MDIETWQVVAAVALPVAAAGPLLRWHQRIRREGKAALARDRARRIEAARQAAHDRRYGIRVGTDHIDVQLRPELWAARVAAAEAEAPMIEAMREKVR